MNLVSTFFGALQFDVFFKMGAKVFNKLSVESMIENNIKEASLEKNFYGHFQNVLSTFQEKLH